MLRAGGCADAQLCGSALLLTLLPFLGKIVYDGTLRLALALALTLALNPSPSPSPSPNPNPNPKP